jgi:hypothetical protein
MMIALYRSAETGRTVELPASELDDYVPPVARGAYRDLRKCTATLTHGATSRQPCRLDAKCERT